MVEEEKKDLLKEEEEEKEQQEENGVICIVYCIINKSCIKERKERILKESSLRYIVIFHSMHSFMHPRHILL